MEDLPTPEEFEKLGIEEKLAILMLTMKAIDNIKNIEIPKNFSEKKVGDTVQLEDAFCSNYLWTEDKKENCSFLLKDKILMAREKAIVIETNCDLKLKCNHCDNDHTVDILLYFVDKKEKYYSVSQLIKIV